MYNVSTHTMSASSHPEFLICVLMRADEVMDIVAVSGGVESIAMEVVAVLVVEDNTLDVVTADKIYRNKYMPTYWYDQTKVFLRTV